MKKTKDSNKSSTKDDSHKSIRQRIQEIDQEALEAEIDWALDYSQKMALARELLEQYKKPYHPDLLRFLAEQQDEQGFIRHPFYPEIDVEELHLLIQLFAEKEQNQFFDEMGHSLQ